MKLHIIYTYKTEQRHTEYEVEPEALKDKETFKNDILSRLNEYSQEQLVMASVCLFCGKKEMPDWFKKCNGKFMFKDLKEI